jgi:hypothetical protein
MLRWRYVLVVLLLHTAHADEQQIVTSVSRISANTYQVELVFFVQANASQVYRLLTDYKNISKINSSIQSVKQHDVPHLQGDRVELLIHDCIFVFCKSIRRVDDVMYPSEYEIVSTIVPDMSDFSAGETRWRFEEQNTAQTKVSLNATFSPSFWVPPLIGPRALRKLTEARLIESVASIHRLLNETTHE